MKISLRNICSNFDGFQCIIDLYHLTKSCTDVELGIDMSSVGWMDANMCAPFGAVLHEFRFKYNPPRKITLAGLQSRVKNILQKNGFFKNFGFHAVIIPDIYETTIEYQHFDNGDAIAFKNYVARHFRGKGIPDMTPALHRRLRESISEIFSNAIDHSETEYGIFACGQYFPTAHRLDFSIADLGIGIRRNISKKIKLELPPDDAIKWAVASENTTRLRKDGRPGGLGLKLIKDFINLNKGKLQIASDAGYWSFQLGKFETKRFSMPFPGTVVNIEINTADKQSYRLASEIDPSNIF